VRDAGQQNQLCITPASRSSAIRASVGQKVQPGRRGSESPKTGSRHPEADAGGLPATAITALKTVRNFFGKMPGSRAPMLNPVTTTFFLSIE